MAALRRVFSIATPASEDMEIAGVGIPLQALLNLQSRTLHAAKSDLIRSNSQLRGL